MLAVALFHVTVVFEEGDVVGGALDAGDTGELIVELDTGRSHVMADARVLDAGGEIVAELALVSPGEIASEKGCNMLGLDDVHGGAHDRLVERLELGLAAKDYVGGVLDLHEAPVVAGAETAQHRTEPLRPGSEVLMERLCAELVGECLRREGIGDGNEGVIGHLEGDIGLQQLARQPGVAVEVDLQPERGLGRNAHVAQTELLVDEVELEMQALAGGGLEKRAMGGLVVPRLIRRAGLHGREDVDQTGVVSAFGEDLFDPRFLAERLELADELDLQPRLGGEPLGILAQLFAQRRGPLGIVEDTDLVITEKAAHRFGMADIGQRAGDNDPVEAREDAADVVFVVLDKRIHHRKSLYRSGSTCNDRRSDLFGSGFAGLGVTNSGGRSC